MKKEDWLKDKINIYLKKEQIIEDLENKKFEKLFLTKSRKNFSVANLLFKISREEDLKKTLGLSKEFEVYEWVIIISYYAMYMSALAAIARLGFKSRSHAATIYILEYYYVRDNKSLEEKDIKKLSKAYLISGELITKLIESKTRRETAQYEATPIISKENADVALKDADKFMTKIEEILIKQEEER